MLANTINANCQVYDTVFKHYKVQNIVLVTSFGNYQANYKTDKFGNIKFFREFYDSTFKSSMETYFLPTNDQSKDRVLKPVYSIVEGVDTLKCFFKLNENLHKVQDTVVESLGKNLKLYHHTDPFLGLLKMTYIINWLIIKTDFVFDSSSLLCIFPYQDLSQERYWIFKLDINNSFSHNHFFYDIESSDMSGFQLQRIDSTFLKKRKLNKLKNQIMSLKNIQNSTHCVFRDEKSYLLYFDNKWFIYSKNCIIITKNETKKIDQFMRKIARLGWKYFN